jgi:hypothetical protein
MQRVPLTSDEAIDRLRELLAQAGVDLDSPSADDVERTWQVMRRFAAESVQDAMPREQDGDGILAQYGTYDWGDGPRFSLDMTRQFCFEDADGEYDHMSQLNCTFDFEPTEELRAFGAQNLWSFGLPLEEFFDAALAMRGFAGARELGAQPIRLDIDYSDV